MAASFAGSRSLDERRRRRLASEADDGPAAPRGSAEKKGRRRKGKGDLEIRGTRLPFRKIISKRRWKIWGLGLLLLLPVAGILIGALRVEYVARTAGPAVARLLDPSEDRLGRAWGSFMLLIASELSVLIWWVRSHSPTDFGGRFGVWLWGAAACFLFSACVATDAHLFFSATVLHFRLVHFPQLGPENTEILCWLAPAVVFGAGIFRSLHLDMRRCWSSVLVLWLAVFAWLGAAFLQSQTEWTATIARRELMATGVALGGHVLLVVSLLLHARFVLYECAAPPVEPAADATEKKSVFNVLALFRRKAVAEAEPAEGSGSSKKGKSSSKRPTKGAKKPSAKRSSKAGSSDADESDGESEEDWSELEEATKPAAPAAKPEPKPVVQAAPSRPNGNSSVSTSSQPARNDRPAPSAQQHSAQPSKVFSAQQRHDDDDGDDDDEGGGDRNSSKGMSKRERRKMQKQLREQQRAA